jgi:hypothetical protein
VPVQGEKQREAVEEKRRVKVVYDNQGIMRKATYAWGQCPVTRKSQQGQEYDHNTLHVGSTMEEDDVEAARSIFTKLEEGQGPIAVLCRTDDLEKVLSEQRASEKLTFIHILWPVRESQDLKSNFGTWVCRGVEIPEGEVFAQ